MSELTKADLELWIADLMKTKKIDEYTINVSGKSEKGDGYLGEITFVSVVTQHKAYNLVIKSAKKGDQLRQNTPIKEAYDREGFFYSKIFPIFKEFQIAQNIDTPFTSVPKCYSVHNENNKEAIILQNLKLKGYELHNRQKSMNMQHIHLVFAQYARFHAISMALQLKQPSLFKSITKNMSDVMGLFVEQAKMTKVFEASFQHVKKLLEIDEEANLKKFEGFEQQFSQILINFSGEDTKPCVITHGDCWNNNFMFKYDVKDGSKPVEMVFLDFQLSRVASPIIDLSYFLYSCADGTVLKDFDFILQAYYSSLADALSEMGCDVEAICSLQELKEQWRTYGKFGLVMSLFIIKIAMCDAADAPDLMGDLENGGDFNDVQIELKDSGVYDARIKDVFVHFAERFM